MRIGIVTFTMGDNYGQRLQNYALQTILQNGRDSVLTIKQNDCILNHKKIIKSMIKSIVGRCSVYEWMRLLRFKRFDSKIKYYKHIIDPLNIPDSLTGEFDIFISGSDQVWAPVPYRFQMYMLGFAKDSQKFSYAASIAADSIPEEYLGQYIEMLSGFQILSIREKRCLPQLNAIKKTIHVSLDPTFLIPEDEWKKLEKRPQFLKNPEKYIFVYNLGTPIDQKVYQLAGEKNLSVIPLTKAEDPAYAIGPEEFLYLIAHAELVCTDSYHGIVFSIIFKKRFVYIERIQQYISMVSRFETLFEFAGIRYEDVMKYDWNQIDSYKYDEKYKNLDGQIEKSREVIHDILTIAEGLHVNEDK